MVQEVSPGTPGEKAGLRVGDVITHLDGEVLEDSQGLTDFLWSRKSAGDALAATIRRGSEVLEVEMVLARRPD